MNGKVKRMHAVIHGRVQGVFFRESTRRQAKQLGLSGWVRNLANGTVETEFQGEQEAVQQMLDWLGQGPTYSRVAQVEILEQDPVSGELGFIISW